MGDKAADRDAGVAIKQRQDGIPDRPADVLEINVDSIWTDSGQRLRKLSGSMIYGSIEPKLIADIGAFRGASGNSDRPGTRDAGKLAYEGSHRPACRGHDHRFTSLGLGSLRPEAPAPVLRVRGGQFFSCGSPAAERRTSDQRGALRQGPKCVGFTTDKGVRVLPLD
jgi:hypothetical protein